MNSKWIRPKYKTYNYKILRRKHEKSFRRLDLAMISWIQYQKHRQQQQKDKLYFVKIKNFCESMVISVEWKGNPWNEENICKSYIFGPTHPSLNIPIAKVVIFSGYKILFEFWFVLNLNPSHSFHQPLPYLDDFYSSLQVSG